MQFQKYIHLERFGTDEVQGIELGRCYIFPKIDGTNASTWYNNGVQAGSRKRHLSTEADNAGFHSFATSSKEIASFHKEFPTLRLFGEWLVPHSLRTYRDDAWRKFYVFDVVDNENNFIQYEEYASILDRHNIDYIPPICIINNASYDSFLKELDNSTFLIKEGYGSGEGIVIKNYRFRNRFDRVCWAKIVTNSFKEKHVKAMGACEKNGKQMVEQVIVDMFVGKHLVDKVYAKIVNEQGGWQNKYIPRLLSTVFYDLVNEEIWNAVKKLNNPTVNFKTLNSISILKVKELRPELF